MALSLLSSPPPEVRQQIVSTFFLAGYKELENLVWKDYFDYYERELKSLSLGVFSPRKTIPGLAAQSHDDVIYLCSVLWTSKALTKCEIRNYVRARFPGAENASIDRSLDLTVRLWLMLNVYDENTPRILPKALVRWNASSRLDDVISSQFQPSTLRLGSRESRLNPSFTGSYMVRVCGLRLKWTDSLEDHLRLDRRSKELWVFSYKNFLLRHLHTTDEEVKRSSPVLPRDLILETITTLNLLFPQWDPPTQLLLSSHNQTFHTVAPFGGPIRLDLTEFNYWRDRLFELYEEIYLAPAETWRQMWTDRRNPLQWWTFWVALVVLILSIISCIASVVQAWASVAALRIQRSSSA